MSSVHQVLHYTGGISPESKTSRSIGLRLFSDRIKATWLVIVALTFIAELIPLSPMPFWLFALYSLTKISLSFAIGYLIPLSFYHLNGIGMSFASSFSSAMLVETLQGVLSNGHSFHWLELAGKLALTVIGFAIALTRRYELRISVGPVDIQLQTGHLG